MQEDKKSEAQRRLIFDILDLIDELDRTCNFYDFVWTELYNGSRPDYVNYDQFIDKAIMGYWDSINALRRKMMAVSERYDQDSK